jgi:hypothetical protein
LHLHPPPDITKQQIGIWGVHIHFHSYPAPGNVNQMLYFGYISHVNIVNVTIKQKHDGDIYHFSGLGWHAHLQSLILFLLMTAACLLSEEAISEK